MVRIDSYVLIRYLECEPTGSHITTSPLPRTVNILKLRGQTWYLRAFHASITDDLSDQERRSCGDVGEGTKTTDLAPIDTCPPKAPIGLPRSRNSNIVVGQQIFPGCYYDLDPSCILVV